VTDGSPRAAASKRGSPGAAAPRAALRLAHRGDWRRAPENTLAAMRAALAIPACDGLEFDVRMSRDGVPILLHDPTLGRVQGVEARAADLMAAELASLGVPTLDDVFGVVGRRPFLDIELKEPATAHFVEVVERHRGHAVGLENAVVSSFHPEILEDLAGRRPEWPRWGNALDLEPRTIEIATALGCSGVSVLWRAITPAGLARVRAAGLDLAAWTVRRRPTFDRLERLGVMAVCVEANALDG
jgi:glycerophosphoryl diester phosphodiesterase